VSAGSVDLTGVDAWVRDFARRVDAEKDHLTALDSAIGDADHGANMTRGLKAVVAALDAEAPADPAALLKKAGMTMVSTVGGASGPLYGTFFLRVATAFGSEASVDADGFGRALRAGLEGVRQRGKAEVGDKTMLDALTPALDAYDGAARDGLGAALSAAADAAAQGREATVPLQARKGRASYLGERSIGHADPGATSVTLLLEAARDTLGGSSS
jgi:dihydroxyacetone kinase-like protein